MRNEGMRRMAWAGILLPAFAMYTMAATKPASLAHGSQTADTTAPAAVRTISIEAKRFEFTPAEITLKKGETVKLELTSQDVHHSLVVKGLGIHGDMEKGKITDVSVTPQETGDFKGECGHFCGSGHGKMRFVVHVVNP